MKNTLNAHVHFIMIEEIACTSKLITHNQSSNLCWLMIRLCICYKTNSIFWLNSAIKLFLKDDKNYITNI